MAPAMEDPPRWRRILHRGQYLFCPFVGEPVGRGEVGGIGLPGSFQTWLPRTAPGSDAISAPRCVALFQALILMHRNKRLRLRVRASLLLPLSSPAPASRQEPERGTVHHCCWPAGLSGRPACCRLRHAQV
eukprot:364487-Chlamydomonas_euryale.AAC.6